MVHIHLFGVRCLRENRSSREKSEITIPNAFVHIAHSVNSNGKRVSDGCEMRMCEWDGCDRWRSKSFHQKQIRYMKFVCICKAISCYLFILCVFSHFSSFSVSWAIRFAVRLAACETQHATNKHTQHKTWSYMHDSYDEPASLENLWHDAHRWMARDLAAN